MKFYASEEELFEQEILPHINLLLWGRNLQENEVRGLRLVIDGKEGLYFGEQTQLNSVVVPNGIGYFNCKDELIFGKCY